MAVAPTDVFARNSGAKRGGPHYGVGDGTEHRLRAGMRGDRRHRGDCVPGLQSQVIFRLDDHAEIFLYGRRISCEARDGKVLFRPGIHACGIVWSLTSAPARAKAWGCAR